MFQKRHYEVIAKALNKAWIDGIKDEDTDEKTVDMGIEAVIDALSDVFKADNARFDFGMFTQACYEH